MYVSGYADGELLGVGLLRVGLESFKEKCGFSGMLVYGGSVCWQGLCRLMCPGASECGFGFRVRRVIYLGVPGSV